MTVEYGYLGSIDVTSAAGSAGVGVMSRTPVLQSSGEPVYTTSGEERWAEELKSSDGKWRHLKGGDASGRGVGNVFDTLLADNFTVLCLGRSMTQSAVTPVYKGYMFATNAWTMRTLSGGSQYGAHVRFDNTIDGFEQLYPSVKATKNQQWFWHGFSRASSAIRQYVNGGAVSTHASAMSDVSNTEDLIIDASSRMRVAAVLCFSRVLTDAEVANICAGKVMPKDVAGLVGYYKFNETHGDAYGQCTDYSGQGNHLTYGGAASWEVFDPASALSTNFASGQPYVSRTKRNEANWWERVPPAIADPERMGGHVGVPTTVPYNALMNLTGDITYVGWVKPINFRTGGAQFALLNGPYSTCFGPISVFAVSGGKTLRVTIGATGVSATNTDLPLTAGIPFGKWVFVAARLSGTTVTAFLNGVSVGSATNAIAHGNAATNWQFAEETAPGKIAQRSVRLFSRALSADEINELFLTDKIGNRTGLVAEWLLNTPHSTTISDTSGNGLNTTTSAVRLIDSPYTVPRRKRTGKQLNTVAAQSATVSNVMMMRGTGVTTATVSGWIKNKTRKTSGAFFGVQTATPTSLLSLVAATQNRITGYVRSDASNSALSVPINYMLSDIWPTLISFEYDYVTQVAKCYANGKLVYQATLAITGGTVYSYIGEAAPKIQVCETSSCVDAVRVYNRALTAAEHYALFLDQAPRNGLVAEYLFDNDVSSCLDSSGNGYHATWSGITLLGNYVQEM